MQKWLTLLLFICFHACSERISESDLNYINGYWEIQEVKFPNGKTKEYDINMTIDYFEFDKMQGFRKKMQPTLKGTFLTSDDALPMKVLWRDQRLFLSFQGEEVPWEEEVLKLQQDVLITRHANGLRYEYSRYEPLLIPE